MAFDVITPARFGSSELAISPTLTTIRTTPALTRDIVKTLDIANNNTATAKVSVYLVPSGDVADNDNVIIPTVEIPGNSVLQWSGAQVLEAGGKIQATSTVADVCLTASGGEAV